MSSVGTEDLMKALDRQEVNLSTLGPKIEARQLSLSQLNKLQKYVCEGGSLPNNLTHFRISPTRATCMSVAFLYELPTSIKNLHLADIWFVDTDGSQFRDFSVFKRFPDLKRLSVSGFTVTDPNTVNFLEKIGLYDCDLLGDVQGWYKQRMRDALDALARRNSKRKRGEDNV